MENRERRKEQRSHTQKLFKLTHHHHKHQHVVKQVATRRMQKGGGDNAHHVLLQQKLIRGVVQLVAGVEL